MSVGSWRRFRSLVGAYLAYGVDCDRAVVTRHIEVSDRPNDFGPVIAAAHPHAEGVDAALDFLGGHPRAGDIEEEDVGRDSVVDQFHPGNARQALREKP